jgi:hypothetical protein
MIRLSFRQTLVTIRSTFLALFLLLIALPTPAYAQTKTWTKGEAGSDQSACVADVQYGETTFTDIATIQGVECLVANILATATTFIGLISFVMIIIGAFYYLVSGGNTHSVELAQKSITFGLIGILVALLAYFILFLISDFTGVDTFLEFNLNVGN